MGTVEVLGFKLIKDDLSIVPLDKRVLINTISPNSYGLSVHDGVMRDALVKADYLVLDGLYFGLAPLLLKGKLVKRFAGWDCFSYFSKKINEKHGKVFFIGSSDDTLNRIKQRYNNEFPDIRVDVFSPPFKDIFSEEDLTIMRDRINAFEPDVVFVGMTAPKQEKWGYQNKEFLNTHLICTIGNVFDWYAGNSVRPGKFWQKVGLEWFIRIFYRPEVFKRNIRNQMLFFWHLILFVFKIKKHD
ncbi:MAG: WecB/TagA/CpsF family glycosyltransferase [Bacteroidales bacterium]|nr:WecB/TagA/CpsF family glycosyltransferase [Bacteroidales bacterium]